MGPWHAWWCAAFTAPCGHSGPSWRSAAGGGAARRSRWPGALTAGAVSTGATRAASAWHANVAFAPRRTRQHAWNLHQHCTLAQVPLIDLKSILLKNFAKRIYFKITFFFTINHSIWPFFSHADNETDLIFVSKILLNILGMLIIA